MTNNQKGRSKFTWNTENLFSGTAWYYSRYRPGYPDELFRLLVEKYALDGFSRVLDLGCGTGQITVQIAKHVSEVIAVDPNEEMLNEAKKQFAAQSIKNVRCILGESGNLPQMADEIGKINLTFIARAFHWMDGEQTLKDLYRITQPGGGVSVIDDSRPSDNQKLPWKKVIDQKVKHWLGEERKAGTEGTFSPPAKRFEAILKESAFQNLEIVRFDLTRSWTIDRIVGCLYSTSSSSPLVLGNKKEAFEADLRAQLRELEPAGEFQEPITVEIMMVRKT
jgi:ubiquinone/menaquinone biosynthesis C-methylase UbiE